MAKNLLPRKYGRNEKNGEIFVPCEEFAKLLSTKINGLGYNHLTTWSTLCKMLEPVEVPDDEAKHRMLHIGAAVNMNDENDKRCGKHVFFTSFSFGPTENISMWTNYGIPNKEAIRIKFTDDSIISWINDFKAGAIKVYGVGDDYSLTPLQAKAEVKLVQVAYWSKTENSERKKKDPNDGLFFYDNEKYRLKDCPDVNAWMAERPYLFKEYGWSYEKEVRLVLVFDEDVADQYKRVAVPFDKPFQNLIKSFKDHVTQGPWYNDKSPKEEAGGRLLSEAKPSRYKGLVKMRSVCDNCKLKDTDDCNCPYEGQR